MADALLTLNAGSSSLKFSLFEIAQDRQLRLASEGQIEGIGSLYASIGRIVQSTKTSRIKPWIAHCELTS